MGQREGSGLTPEGDGREAPSRVKAALINPATMTVAWANEPALQAASASGEQGTPMNLDRLVPMSDSLGMPDALRAVAETGVSRQVQFDLVNTARGGVAVVASIHRLPDGMLLVLVESTWRHAVRPTDASRPRRPSRRSR